MILHVISDNINDSADHFFLGWKTILWAAVPEQKDKDCKEHLRVLDTNTLQEGRKVKRRSNHCYIQLLIDLPRLVTILLA